MFGDSNSQIKLRAKQKFKFLSATKTQPTINTWNYLNVYKQIINIK